MTQKIILFFSCEPGGAEVLIPVIKLVVKETSHKVIVLGYGLGAERFARKDIEYIEIGRIGKNDPTIMNTYWPDLVITSATSLPERDMSEKYLWHNARLAGIPTIAFLDQWQNYAVRFSGTVESERLAYLPDYINCINEIGEREMIEEGFDPHGLVKFGQPYLSSLINDAKLIDTHEIKNRLEIAPGQRVVLFASEAIQEHYGHSRGYDQYDALRLFLELMLNATQETVLLIKLHPKDTPEEYERILSEYPTLRSRVVKNELSSIESIQISDEVYGMTSIMLIEAYILGKKTTSLQPGLVGEDSCVLSRYGVIPTITSKNITDSTQSVISIKNDFEFDFQFKKNRFLKFIDLLTSRPRN
jgi:predicted glycosyltransferase